MKEKWNQFRNRWGKYLSPTLYFLSLLVLDVSFRSVHSSAGVTPSYHAVPFLFSIFWALLFGSGVFFIPGRAKKVVMSVFLSVFVAVDFVHAILYHVSRSFLSFSDVAFAENGVAFLNIQYLTFSWKIYLALLLPTFIGIISILLVPKNPKKLKITWLEPVIAGVLALGSIVGIWAAHTSNCTTGTNGQFQWTDTYSPDSISAIYTDFSDPNECLMFCGTYQYLFRSCTQSLFDTLHHGAMRKNLDQYYAMRQENPEPNAMTGALKGQNLIAIMLESIDTWLITEEIMPNLYHISQKSIDFQNHYTPLYLSAGTFNTEFAFNIGYYLPTTGTTARTYATNVYPQSLPNLFRNAGYTANSYHALDGRFYNRQLVHLQWGYETFNDHEDMKLEGLQVRDTTLLEAYEMFVTHDKPFFSYLITYSGHGPYTEARQDIAELHLARARKVARASGITTENEDTWDQFVRCIAHAMETDEMIGQLLEAMEQDGHIHDTALVFFGDHYAKYLTDVGFLMDLKGTYDANTLCNTPFYIYSEKLDPMTVDKVTSSIDMLPTIANLFGLDYNARYLVGDDAFGDGGGFVCFKDYSWIDGETYWYPEYDGEETEKIRERNREVREKLVTSWNTVKTNYFEYLEKKK